MPIAIRLAVEVDDVVLGHVVAERVEELRRDHVGRARQLRIGERVELQQILPAGGVANAEAGSDAFVLRRDHRPLAGGRRMRIARAGLQFRQAHVARRVTVRVPGAVGHLVNRIDGLRRQKYSGVRRPLAGGEEGVVRRSHSIRSISGCAALVTATGFGVLQIGSSE